jgi:phytoene dehydrogenase-like protein
LTAKNADFWIKLRENDHLKYTKIKNALAEKVIDQLDYKLEHIKDNVEVIDVATPATFYRYTGNWKGSIQGWMPKESLFAATPVKNTLPGLKNFYMTGHWMQPGGGVPIALLTGRNLAQVICKQDGKKFETIEKV